MEIDKAPIKLSVNHNFLRTAVFVISTACSIVVFTFSTFVTKTDLAQSKSYDEKVLLLLREDVKELRQDVKELLKQTKGK